MRSRNPFLVYLFMHGAASFAYAVIFTVNIVYQVEVVGLNPLQLVLVGTLLETVCFVCEVPTGIVADVYSRRLSVIIGFLLQGSGFVLEGAIPAFAAVLGAQILWGVGATFVSGAEAAWIADEMGEARVGPIYVRGSQVGQIAGAVGVVVSVALASIRLNLAVVVGGLLLFALGVALIVFMPEHGFRPTPRGERTTWQTMTGTFRTGTRLVRATPVLVMLMAAAAFYGASSEGFDRLWQAHILEDFTLPALGGLDPVVWFGIIALGATPLTLVAGEVMRRRLDMTDERAMSRALVVLTALRIGAVVAFGLAGSFGLAVACFWGLAVVGSLAWPITAAWLNQGLDSRVRATVLSMESQSNAFGQIAGGPVVGVVGTAGSLRLAMVAVAVALSPLLWLYARAARRAAPLPVAEEVIAVSEP